MSETTLNEAKARMERTRQHYMYAPLMFLDAWKEAVKMAGPRLFTAEPGYIKPDSIDDAEDKWQLIPDINAIREYCNTCSVSEGVFIGTLVSFYNTDIGNEILERFGWSAVGGVANRLELDQLEVITKLMLNHTGW